MDDTAFIAAGRRTVACPTALAAAARAYAEAVEAADAAMTAYHAVQAKPDGWKNGVIAAGAKRAETRARRERLAGVVRRLRAEYDTTTAGSAAWVRR